MLTALAITAVALVALPGVGHRLGLRTDPQRAARHTATSLVAGGALLEVGLMLCAASVLLPLAGLSPWGLFGTAHLDSSLGQLVGWLAVPASLAFPVATLWGWGRTRSERMSAVVHESVGEHTHFSGVDVVVLPSGEMAAFALPGAEPQIVMSQSAVDRLSAEELEMVVLHEMQHVMSHGPYLSLISLLRPLVRVIPGLASSLQVLGYWLERWADEAATSTEEDRCTLGDVLTRFSFAAPAAAAALGGPDTVSDRIAALREGGDRGSMGHVPLLVAMSAFSVAGILGLLVC